MLKKNGGPWFILILGFILVFGHIIPIANLDCQVLQCSSMAEGTEESGMTSSYTKHGLIYIDGDANFSDTALAEGWSGNGTESNPYLIEGLEIDGSTSPSEHCIEIQNTLVHFIIRGCFLGNSTVACLRFGNVTNAIIRNSIFESGDIGIQLVACENILILSNTCTGNTGGINLDDGSLYNQIFGNNCTGNSEYGIYLQEDSDNNEVRFNICNSNTEYGIWTLGSHFNVITDNICDGNLAGIYIIGCDSDTLTGNICYNNIEYGIWFYASSSNQVTNNTCESNNNIGIHVEDASYNSFANNTCIDNSQYGLVISGSVGNEILWNVFSGNGLDNAYNTGSGTIFDCNFWSDYIGSDDNQDGIGDSPYSVPGGASDSHPLIYLPYQPSWTCETPEELIAWYPAHFQYNFTAAASAPIFWSVNNSMYFTIDDYGAFESLGSPPAGKYEVEVSVANIYGVSLSVVFRVTVFLDAYNPPGWWFIPANQLLEYGEVFDYQLIAIDPSGIDRWELNDTIHFSLQTSSFADGSTARIKNSTILAPGSYGLNITVYDIYKNKLSAIFQVIVEMPEQDETAPVWVVAPVDDETEQGEVFMQRLGAWDKTGIVSWWLNDTVHFYIDGNGVIRNATALEPGVYRLEVRAYNLYDNYCSATLVITVLEPAPTTTTTTTTTTTATEVAGLDPLVMFGVGGGVGAVAVLAVIFLFMRKKS